MFKHTDSVVSEFCFGSINSTYFFKKRAKLALLPYTKEVAGRSCFDTCLSFCSQGTCFPQCHGEGRSPSGGTSPQVDRPPEGRPPDTVNVWVVPYWNTYLLGYCYCNWVTVILGK